MDIKQVREKYPQYKDLSDRQLADALHQKFYADMPKDEFYQKVGAKPAYSGGSFRAATEGSQAGLMFGFDDEITAGMLAPIDAAIDWFKGNGFDIGKAYTRKQKMLDDQKAARREEHPYASLGGEVAGGLATGGGLAKSGITLVGRAAPGAARVGAAALEGAGYGGLYGAGEAKPGERVSGAGTGAAIGAATGGVLGLGGEMLAKSAAKTAMRAAIPEADDLAKQSSALYDASKQFGVTFKEPAVKRLGQNLKIAAGNINDKLRPLTAGTVDDIEKMFSGRMTLEQFDEFRQGLNLDLNAARGQDKVFLARMKKMVDHFADNVSPSDMTGGPQGIEVLKGARKLWQQAKKAETVERIMDYADVQTGRYTQSGLANAIKQEMKKLYRSIQAGKEKGWTQEEVALIRQMSKGGSTSKTINLLAKFAPRGPVSIVSGQWLGSAVPGGNIAAPLLGHAAGQAADSGALQAAQTLRGAAATGVMPRLPFTPNRAEGFIPATSILANRAMFPLLPNEPRR